MAAALPRKKIFSKICLLIAVAGLLIWLLAVGLQDQQDPYWNELDSLMDSGRYRLLEESGTALQTLFLSVQPGPGTVRHNALQLLSRPFLPTLEFRTFAGLVQHWKKNRFIVISGVTGSGKTTVATRLARFFAADPEREMYVTCVPKFEVVYHRRYVGHRDGERFYPGKLLRLFATCRRNPQYNYVLVLDDIDKMNPESFFGPALWGELDNPSYAHPIEGYTSDVSFPSNFYMMSVTHSGVGQVVPLNNEHFRRLGNPFFLAPNTRELFLHLSPKFKKQGLPRLHLKRLLYVFEKTNRLVRERYGAGSMLGQWSMLRKLYRPQQLERFLGLFIEHVNAFKPTRPLSRKDLESILYAAFHRGYVPGSNPLASFFAMIVQLGLFSEFTVGLLFIIVSALAGWLVFRRRQLFMRDFLERVYAEIDRFSRHELSFEEVRSDIMRLKREIDDLMLQRRLKHEEALFFYVLIDDRLRALTSIEQARDLGREFSRQLNEFLADGVLDSREYGVLKRFLTRIRYRIAPEDYRELEERIEHLQESAEKSGPQASR